MRYYMPTKIYDGDGIVLKQEKLFKKLGKKALIVTGKTSAKKCGALDDVITVFNNCGIEYKIFDEVKANPPIQQTKDGAILGMGSDFVLAIGGGSSMDTAKGIAILLKHGIENHIEKLFGKEDYDAVPVIAIPTTTGTGSEVTPYSVFTDDELKTKLSMPRRIFPLYSFIDIKYFMTMPTAVRNTTIMDALSHSIESIINVRTSPYSELFAFKALNLFRAHKDELMENKLDQKGLKDFVLASTFAGVAISQTGTSLPHALGYPITYQFGFPHGMANVTFMAEFFRVSPKEMVERVLEATGFKTVEEFAEWIKKFIALTEERPPVKEEYLEDYAKLISTQEAKLKSHPTKITHEDLLEMYRNSVL